jgi:hypothetical protein
MNIPNFIDSQVIDSNGFLTTQWKQIFMLLFSELQNNAGNEGIFIPQQSNANITLLTGTNSTGSIVYNTDTNKAMVSENGTFKTIQTT